MFARRLREQNPPATLLARADQQRGAAPSSKDQISDMRRGWNVRDGQTRQFHDLGDRLDNQVGNLVGFAHCLFHSTGSAGARRPNSKADPQDNRRHTSKNAWPDASGRLPSRGMLIPFYARHASQARRGVLARIETCPLSAFAMLRKFTHNACGARTAGFHHLRKFCCRLTSGRGANDNWQEGVKSSVAFETQKTVR
jgi:hypothetical protein